MVPTYTYPTFHIFILLTDFALGAREGVNDLCAHRAPSNNLHCGAKASQHMEWRSEGEENPRKRLALPRTFPVRYGVAPCLPCILAFPEVRRAAVRAEGVQESPTFAALGFSGLKCPNQPEWLIILDSTVEEYASVWEAKYRQYPRDKSGRQHVL